jgi:peptidyl-tRNA hydrolase, PTH1 family
VPTTLVVGLGNPGQEYAASRHNVGFMVVDELSRRLKGQFRPGKGEFWFTRSGLAGDDLLLVKPVTYMNRSGIAVLEVVQQFAVPTENVVVVLDDFALPLGALRLRPGGSDGGHNGLASVIYHLQTDCVARVRCGIRAEVMPPKDLTADFVLSPFADGELKMVEGMIERAADAVLELQRSGVERAMGLFNTTPTAPET